MVRELISFIIVHRPAKFYQHQGYSSLLGCSKITHNLAAIMDKQQFHVKLRRPNPIDVENLHRMILDSTSGKTRITSANLHDDLFVLNQNCKPDVKSHDPCVNFDVNRLSTNRPNVQALVAEADSNLVGYLMFRYYYSPWMAHTAFIVDLFTSRDHRRKGVATKLLDELTILCKSENLSTIIFNAGYMNQELVAKAREQGFKWFRNEDTDWSVLRIDL